MKTFKVTDECISCHACVNVASTNFKMGEEKAYVFKQPENEEQEKLCQSALEVCPVGAIESEEKQTNTEQKDPILAKHKVKEILDKYPQLKDVLVEFSDKFKKLLNPVMYNTMARFATFNEASKVTGISICEILHVLNKAIGTEELLLKMAPECLKDKDFQFNIFELSDDITWKESSERYIYNQDSMPEIIEKVSHLKPQENIVIISVKEPVELVKTAKGLNLSVNIEKLREYRVSIFNPEKVKNIDWRERKENFEQLDVRSMKTDPFDIIIQKAYATAEDDGFILIQRFEPIPMINMLAEMGFEHETEHISPFEVWVYFYKTPISDKKEDSNKTEVVIQSATPVAYPVIMRLLQSDVIRKNLKIKELKVWEETEKHLAWVTNGKADISFSALLTSIKIQRYDIKVPALFVWDNFVILARYKANGLEDIKGKIIYTPLFADAPPTKITKYLIKVKGLNPDDFNFAYGEPFGRPEEIYAAFVQGQADTVILREPEASYALKIMQDRGEEVSVISFNEIWNEVNPGFGSFPNAGVVFKGDFVRKNPELTKLFLEELKKAIDWVNNNKPEAANLSFDMMRQPADRVELFLNRVNFDYVSGDILITKVKDYMRVLQEQNIIESKLDESYYEIFKM